MAKAQNYLMWNMTRKCNFRCHYCYFPHDATPVQENLSNTALKQLLDATGREWVIGMTGGEPFLYPDFVDRCASLAETHKLSVDTNLSLSRAVRRFAEIVPPERVHDMYVALHIEERERRNAVEPFIDNVLALTDKGFEVVVNYVLHPTLVDRYPADRDYFAERGVTLTPRPFKGLFGDREYPGAYAATTRAFFSETPGVSDPGKKMVFDFGGVLCNGGRTFLRMEPDGVVYRCSGEKTVLGSLETGVTLYDEPQPCRARRCPCLGPNHVALTPTEELVFQGVKRAATGDVDAATERFAEALTQERAMSTATVNLGWLAWDVGDRATALAHFREAFTTDPTAPYVAGNLAAAQALQGDTADALATLDAYEQSSAHKLDKRMMEPLRRALAAKATPSGWPRLSPSIKPHWMRDVDMVVGGGKCRE